MTIMQPIDGANPSDNVMCPRCGTLLASQTRFCGFCGEHITKQETKEREAHTENGDDYAQEQEVDDTVRIPSVSQAQLQGLQVRAPEAHPVLIVRGMAFSNELQGLQVRAPGAHSGSTMRGGTFIWRPWLIALSLANRVRSNSLLRNSIYIMGTGVATAVIGYLYWVLAAHLYSTYDVGLGSALISVMTLAATFANLGMGSTLVQTLPRREAGYAWSLTLNAGLAMGILSGLLTGVIVVIALLLFSSQFSIVGHQASYALVLVVGVPLMTVSSLLDQAFIAERAAHNMLVRNAAVAVLKIPLLVLPVVLLAHVGALGIFASGVLSIAIVLIGGLLLLVPRLGRAYCLAARGIVGQVRSMLSLLTGNYFINLGGLTPQYLLPVFVASRLSPTDNAYFYTTMKLTDFFFMASSAVAVSLFAEGSHAVDDLARKVRSSAVIIGILLGPAMLVCFFGGRYILLVFGPGYAQHGLTLLRIYVVAAVPDSITNIYVSVLRVQRRLRFAALLNLSMATLTLALSWMLLPILGIAGGGLAFLISQGVGSLAAGVDAIRLRYHRRGID